VVAIDGISFQDRDIEEWSFDSLFKSFKMGRVMGFGRKQDSGWMEVGSIVVDILEYGSKPILIAQQEAETQAVLADPLKDEQEVHPERNDELPYPTMIVKVSIGICLILASVLVSLSFILRD
jgi:hypothetical protein